MSFWYTNAKRAILAGEIDLDTAGDDVRLLLVMSNTTADTTEDAATITGLGTLDEMDGSGYARQALAGEAVTADNANDRGEFDANDTQFASVSAGTRQVVGAVLYKHVDGTPGNDIPIAYIDGTGFPFDPGGGNIDFAWNAEGILHAA